MGVTGRAAVALVVEVAFVVLTLGVRMGLQWRRTGESGFKMQKLGSIGAEQVVLLLMVAAGAGLAVATIAGLAGNPLGGPDELPVVIVVAAVIVSAAAIAATFWAQLSMGDSWRIGQDRDESTALVTRGLFRMVRNPIYTAMMAFIGAVLVLLPSLVMLIGFVAACAAIEVVVRDVEEPFLRERHGESYITWCSQAGRFLPRVGRN